MFEGGETLLLRSGECSKRIFMMCVNPSVAAICNGDFPCNLQFTYTNHSIM